MLGLFVLFLVRVFERVDVFVLVQRVLPERALCTRCPAVKSQPDGSPVPGEKVTL